MIIILEFDFFNDRNLFIESTQASTQQPNVNMTHTHAHTKYSLVSYKIYIT